MRRFEVLRLRQEIERLDVAQRMDFHHPPKRAVHFSDIEHGIIKFSGNDRTLSVFNFFFEYG